MGIDDAAPVSLIVFRQILEGDRRKFIAQSNDTQSGGGARDIRFRPYEEFAPVFEQLFPNSAMMTRVRDGGKIELEIRKGRFYWIDADEHEQSQESSFEPPTTARPDEGRLPMVHTYPCFENLPSRDEGILLLLLIQRPDGTVWPTFATEKSLKSGDWNSVVANTLLACMYAKRKQSVAVSGFIDLKNGREYCNGRVL